MLNVVAPTIPAPSPPLTQRFDSFSLPGDRDVTSQRDGLSSNDTTSRASSMTVAA